MGRDWEETFRGWSKPSSETEETKAANAVRMIRDAIWASSTLSTKNIEIFAQGSYRNNTNVRQDSDVDICVRCSDVFFADLSDVPEQARNRAGLSDAHYTYSEFKDDVGKALVNQFGKEGVTRCNKAFDVHENSYRVDADVVPTFEHRSYFINVSGKLDYISGVEFHPDNGGRIVNWPHQHYENGVAKNLKTGNRFKYITRAIKRLRHEMNEKKIKAAGPIPSYLIECLAFNVPDEGFASSSYTNNVRYLLAHVFNETRSNELCEKWIEVNGIKYLFHWSQPWTQQQAQDFVSAAWDYVGF